MSGAFVITHMWGMGKWEEIKTSPLTYCCALKKQIFFLVTAIPGNFKCSQ